MTYISNEPNAYAILESLRSIGYDLPTAIADIIDNSITAKATDISIYNNESINDKNPDWIAIVDNGCGMTSDKLVSAMGLGSELAVREPNDLGRFGFGLKTASISQCRRLTVVTKSEDGSEVSGVCLDLDKVRTCVGWNYLKKLSNIELKEILVKIKGMPNAFDISETSGTIVLWEELDRFNNLSKNSFAKEISKTKKHLELIFHKFEKDINLRINGNQLIFWNPFNNCTQKQPKKFKFSAEKSNDFLIRGFILKHESEFDNHSEFLKCSRGEPLNNYQGFFVYRNKRLIHYGDWLGVFHKELHLNLSRIAIELDNSQDSDNLWNVNISKSQVSIPNFCYNDLLNYSKSVRKEGAEVYRFHGGIIKRNIIKKGNEIIHTVWTTEKKGTNTGDKYCYQVNKVHPIIENFIQQLHHDDLSSQFKLILNLIQENLPVDSLIARKGSNQLLSLHKSEEELLLLLEKNIEVFINNLGLSRDEAINSLRYVVPFNKLKNIL